jgi:hypothetical protein
MLHSLQYKTARPAAAGEGIGAVRNKIAVAMIGRTVDVLADARTIAHGVVRGVLLTEAGVPKLLVNGDKYELNQILTSVPASLP